MSDIQTIESEALKAIDGASDLQSLDAVRVAELGKKGRVSGLMKTLGKMSPEERQEMGPKLNALKNRVALLHPDAADPDMVGELLRSQLNVVHPNEVVIKLDD